MPAESRDLEQALFGPDAMAGALVATIAGKPVGFALYYPTYSTTLTNLAAELGQRD